jgi:hypothetical protein
LIRVSAGNGSDAIADAHNPANKTRHTPDQRFARAALRTDLTRVTNNGPPVLKVASRIRFILPWFTGTGTETVRADGV